MADIGRVRLKASGRSTISSQNFSVTPNVAVSDLSDATSVGAENGYALIYNSTSGKFEPKAVVATDVELATITGGSF